MNINELVLLFKNTDEKKVYSLDYALRSKKYEKDKKYKEALSQVNFAILLDKSNDSFFYAKSFIFVHLKKYIQALDCINKAIVLNPNIYYYYLHKAFIYYLSDNIEKVDEVLANAKKIMPNCYLYFKRQNYLIYKHCIDDYSDVYLDLMERLKNIC